MRVELFADTAKDVYLGAIELPWTTLTTGGFHSLTIVGGEGPAAKTITGSVDAKASASQIRFTVNIKATVRTPAGGGSAEVK